LSAEKAKKTGASMATNTEILDRINAVATSTAITEQTVRRLATLIEGNGKPGLLERVQVIENRHCNEDDDEKKKKDKRDRISNRTWAVILVLITQAIVQAIGLVTLFMRSGG
jgi:hypothetical protein